MIEAFGKIFNNKIYDFCPFDNISEVILYGAGQMGIDASNCLLNSGVAVKFFADKNPNMIGKKINNIIVKHPEDFSTEEKENCIFAISIITVSYNLIHNYLKDLGCKKICFVGDVVNKISTNPFISGTWRLNDPSSLEINKLNIIFNGYNDDNSKKSMIQFLEWVVNNEEKNNFAPILKMDQKYFIPEVLRSLGDDEVFVNYDALHPESSEKIIELTGNKFNSIHIFAPIKDDFENLTNNNTSDKIKIYPYGLANENSEKPFLNGMGLPLKSKFCSEKTGQVIPIRKLDYEMKNKPYSYFKIYGLGIALDVVKGAIKTIKKFRPIVAVTIHHTEQDFIEIPYFLMNNLGNYNFYLRLHSYCGFETLLYAIPKEKEK